MPERSISMNINEIIKELTLEEKALLVSGTDFMYTKAIPRLGIPSLRMSDGPHGLRVQQEAGDNGVTNSDPATCFPTAATTASSWNPQHAYLMGRAIGEAARHYGVHVVLGPGTNIKRNPLGGRSFEYFSEDPFLSGVMAAAEVLGIQSEGVGVSAKHFALNNSENYRFMGNSVADMRAIREIYLKPFEMIVKDASPETMMCAYNKINGEYCCQNEWLLTEVLRREWGFSGLVMTDWGATHDRLRMLRAGLDLEMPGDTPICRKWIKDAIESGELEMSALDEAVKNVLTLVKKHENDKVEAADFVAQHELAKTIAIDSAVLMKNDGALPLDKNGEYLVIGELFEKTRYQGSGSSMINPTFLSTPKSAFDNVGIKYDYTAGYKENRTKKDVSLINDAVAKAAKYENLILFAGLTDYVESEGADRDNMRLPENQLALIDELIKLGKRITVVLYGGSPFELPFADDVNAILNMYLPGQNGGEAMRELLFGEANPSGKLAESWPIKYEDVPFCSEFGKGENEIYKESIFVGYRYYLSAGKRVRYPFGFGLSYTSFEYSNLSLVEDDSSYTFSCDVTNIGDYDGSEIVQLYVKAPGKTVFAPLRELKGFTKIPLKVGECGKATIRVDKSELRYFNTAENKYAFEGGEYIIEICSDCESVKLSTSVTIAPDEVASPYSDKILGIYRSADVERMTDSVFEEMSGVRIPAPQPKKPIHIESRFSNMKSTFIGTVLYHSVLSVAKKEMKKAKRMPEGVERDNKIKGAIFLKRILNSNSVLTMSMSAAQSFPYNFAEGFVNLANGKIIKGIMCFCKSKNAKKHQAENNKEK